MILVAFFAAMCLIIYLMYTIGKGHADGDYMVDKVVREIIEEQIKKGKWN